MSYKWNIYINEQSSDLSKVILWYLFFINLFFKKLGSIISVFLFKSGKRKEKCVWESDREQLGYENKMVQMQDQCVTQNLKSRWYLQLILEPGQHWVNLT